MFRCAVSGKNSKPSEKGVRIVTKTRPKNYYKEVVNKETKLKEIILVATGFEIVQEKLVLKEVADQLNGEKLNA